MRSGSSNRASCLQHLSCSFLQGQSTQEDDSELEKKTPQLCAFVVACVIAVKTNLTTKSLQRVIGGGSPEVELTRLFRIDVHSGYVESNGQLFMRLSHVTLSVSAGLLQASDSYLLQR